MGKEYQNYSESLPLQNNNSILCERMLLMNEQNKSGRRFSIKWLVIALVSLPMMMACIVIDAKYFFMVRKAFFSNRDTCAWEIPIYSATSICVFPSKNRRLIISFSRSSSDSSNPIRVSRSLKDTAYKAIYAKENLTRKNLREPTIMEISEEIGIPKEDIVYALDAIQNPMSLYEPVYTEGGDTLYVMDQISDKKCKEENWVEN